jgi:hypothetical protein
MPVLLDHCDKSTMLFQIQSDAATAPWHPTFSIAEERYQ